MSLISGLDQIGGFYDNIRLTGIKNNEDVHGFFQAVQNIIDKEQLLSEWLSNSNWIFRHWTFRHKRSTYWYISLFVDCVRCNQMTGGVGRGWATIPYSEIESIECDLFIDGSRLAGIWITLKNGVEIELI